MSCLIRPLRIASLAGLVAASVTVAVAQEEPKPTPPPAPAAPAAAAAPAAVVASAPVSKAVIEFDDKAKGNGEIVFLFTPTGGTGKEIRVTVADKMKGDDVSKDVLKEFSVVLGDSYEASRYDGTKVKIEGKKKATFNLSIKSQNVTGLSVRIK